MRGFGAAASRIRDGRQLIELSRHLLRVRFDLAQAALGGGSALLQRRRPRFDGPRGAQISLVEANFFGVQLTIGPAAAFNFQVQSAQDVCLAIVRATAQETAFGFDRRAISQTDNGIDTV